MSAFDGDMQPKAVGLMIVGGYDTLVPLDEIVKLATLSLCDAETLDTSLLYKSLKGDCKVVAAYTQNTNELVGYVSASLESDGILEVGWLLVLPGFIPGGLGECLLNILCTKIPESKGIRAKFEPRFYGRIYSNIGMLWNEGKECWEAIEKHF